MKSTRDRSRRTTLVVLILLGLAIGWFEGAVVVYLRQIYYPGGFHFPLAVMSPRVLGVEVVREAFSLFILAGIGWLASRRAAGRMGAFLLLFGVWDLVYYGVLKLVLDWPAGLTTPDILFLIPAPWVGPVWAPMVVAAAFTAIGIYLFWTEDRSRSYGPGDVTALTTAAGAIVISFLTDWQTVTTSTQPGFTLGLYVAGCLGGAGWFIRTERRR